MSAKEWIDSVLFALFCLSVMALGLGCFLQDQNIGLAGGISAVILGGLFEWHQSYASRQPVGSSYTMTPVRVMIMAVEESHQQILKRQKALELDRLRYLAGRK